LREIAAFDRREEILAVALAIVATTASASWSLGRDPLLCEWNFTRRVVGGGRSARMVGG